MKPLTILFVLCFIFSEVLTEDLLSIPLTRHKSQFQLLLEQNTHPKHLAKIFSRKNYHNDFSNSSKPRKNDTITLYKYLQSEYFGEVLLGSPGQKFKVVFDTSFVHSWIPSVLCSPFAYPACAVRNKYDSSKSTTFISLNRNFTILTDKGELFGYVGLDKMHIGHISIMNQSFVEIEQMGIKQITNIGPDGVLGMSFDDNINDDMIPFFINIMKEGLIEQPIFSFYINRDASTHKGGSLFLGGSNAKHYSGPFTYLRIIDTATWSFKVRKINVNFKLPYRNETVTVCESGCTAYPNTADTLILGPPKDIKIINRYLGAHYLPYVDRYEISCDKVAVLPHIIFFIGDTNFTLHGKDYIQELSYGPITLCLSAFAAQANVSGASDLIWSFGVSFLGAVYTEFNMRKKTIGFANIIR